MDEALVILKHHLKAVTARIAHCGESIEFKQKEIDEWHTELAQLTIKEQHLQQAIIALEGNR